MRAYLVRVFTPMQLGHSSLLTNTTDSVYVSSAATDPYSKTSDVADLLTVSADQVYHSVLKSSDSSGTVANLSTSPTLLHFDLLSLRIAYLYLLTTI